MKVVNHKFTFCSFLQDKFMGHSASLKIKILPRGTTRERCFHTGGSQVMDAKFDRWWCVVPHLLLSHAHHLQICANKTLAPVSYEYLAKCCLSCIRSKSELRCTGDTRSTSNRQDDTNSQSSTSSRRPWACACARWSQSFSNTRQIT